MNFPGLPIVSLFNARIPIFLKMVKILVRMSALVHAHTALLLFLVNFNVYFPLPVSYSDHMEAIYKQKEPLRVWVPKEQTPNI